MWRYSFAFVPLTLEEQAALEPHIVSPGGWMGAFSAASFFQLAARSMNRLIL
jgi:hypothetical protein